MPTISGIRGEAGGVQLCGRGGAGAGRVHAPPPGLLQGQLQRGALPHLCVPQRARPRTSSRVRRRPQRT